MSETCRVSAQPATAPISPRGETRQERPSSSRRSPLRLSRHVAHEGRHLVRGRRLPAEGALPRLPADGEATLMLVRKRGGSAGVSNAFETGSRMQLPRSRLPHQLLMQVESNSRWLLESRLLQVGSSS